MMELIKRRIHMNRRRGRVTSQMTLDDDFNVPDSMDDMAQLILESGEIQIESARNQGERVTVKGVLSFRVLYRTPDGQVLTLAGGIPFDENVNMPGLVESDEVQVSWELDDLNVGIINSRKLSVKALVTLHIQAEVIEDRSVAEDVIFDGNVETLKKSVEAAVLAVRRKDTFRVKEMLTLPGNRPDVDQILWQDIKLRNISTKPLDGRIHLDGELMLFLIYSGADGLMPVQCMEESIAFSGDVELTESSEDMIPFITTKLIHKEMEVNPDADGEMREISVDAVIELDIRLYREECVEFLSDLYALDREVIPESSEVCFDQITAKNVLKYRIQEKTALPAGQRILQICHSDGIIRLDEIQPKEDGLHLEGVLEATLLALTADDGAPVAAFSEMIPFQVEADVPGLENGGDYRLEPGLEQISAVMLGGDTVEVKAVATFDILALGEQCEQVIEQVREEPVNMELLKKKPGIVGYVVQPGDSLWKIAREFHTSVDEIMAANRLSERIVHPGDKLILVKAVKEHM